jgi:hypothetical protein
MVAIAAAKQLHNFARGVFVKNNNYIITSFVITQLYPQSVWVLGLLAPEIVWDMGYKGVMGYHLQTNLVYQRLYGL